MPAGHIPRTRYLFPLHERDLHHLRGIALPPTKLGDTSVATMSSHVARREFVKDTLDDQLVGQRFEDAAAGAQLNHHRLVRCLQALFGLILIGDDAQQLIAARLQLLLLETTTLIGQRRLTKVGALLVRENSL